MLKLKKIKIGTQWQTSTDSFIIYTRKAGFLKASDTILIPQLELAKITDKNKTLLQRTKCSALAFHPTFIKRIFRPQISIKRFFQEKKNDIKEKLKKAFKKSEYTLFSSIFLGKKENQELYKIRKLFNTWGITHYLARSGLHLALIFILLSALFNILFIPLIIKIFLIFGVCIIYAALSWSSISFTRSLLLMLSYQLCMLLKLPIDSFHLLNLVFLVCIIPHTYLIFQLDFQLTFTLTYSLILINKYHLLKCFDTKILQKKFHIS